MKKKVINLLIVCLIALGCFVFGSWQGSRNGYARGRLEEEKATLHFRLYMYLQLYDMRKQIDSPESPVPRNLISPINTMAMVTSALAFYEKHQQEYDQGRWTLSQEGINPEIGRARKIVEELEEALIQQNIDATNSVVDQTIQQPLEPATNSSSRAVEAETIN